MNRTGWKHLAQYPPCYLTSRGWVLSRVAYLGEDQPEGFVILESSMLFYPYGPLLARLVYLGCLFQSDLSQWIYLSRFFLPWLSLLRDHSWSFSRICSSFLCVPHWTQCEPRNCSAIRWDGAASTIFWDHIHNGHKCLKQHAQFHEAQILLWHSCWHRPFSKGLEE